MRLEIIYFTLREKKLASQSNFNGQMIICRIPRNKPCAPYLPFAYFECRTRESHLKARKRDDSMLPFSKLYPQGTSPVLQHTARCKTTILGTVIF